MNVQSLTHYAHANHQYARAYVSVITKLEAVVKVF